MYTHTKIVLPGKRIFGKTSAKNWRVGVGTVVSDGTHSFMTVTNKEAIFNICVFRRGINYSTEYGG